MDKRIGWAALAVAGVLIVGLCYGFLSNRSGKASLSDRPGVGMAFPELMSQLSRNMSLWERMNMVERKAAIDGVILHFKNRDNVALLNHSEFYAGKIDETLRTNPMVVNLDITTMLRILAIMEYDFYNGENKDALALKTLGQQGFDQNRTRRELAARGGA